MQLLPRMPHRLPLKPADREEDPPSKGYWPILVLSIGLQLILGLFFGHIYDIRIFMATGYLAGTSAGPYVPQDLSGLFHNPSFQGITTVGYPPPWPLLLGVIYHVVSPITSSLLVYNLAIKIPIIAANVALAYVVVAALRRLGASQAIERRAWIFVLLNPFVLYVSAAWGQFDSIVAVLALVSLLLLDSGRLTTSAILLALAVAFKPTAMPLMLVPFFYLRSKPLATTVSTYAVLGASLFAFCVAPFLILRWDASPILQHWNAHFEVGGGISWLTFLELTQGSYQLRGQWWLVGLLWVPALGLAAASLGRVVGLRELIRKSAALIMVFFLTRAWLSEPNILLVLPLVLILTSIGDLDRLTLVAVWILALIFSFFNVSTAQLFFPSMPDVMNSLLQQMDKYLAARLVAKVLVVIPWEVVGWSIVIRCLKAAPARRDTLEAGSTMRGAAHA